MDYLIQTKNGKRNNDMHLITYDQIRLLYEENKHDEEEVKKVTASSDRGESYYRDGITSTCEKRLEFYKEVLYRDVKTTGFLMKYPHGVIIRQGERNHYYRGENCIFAKSQPTLLRKFDELDSDEEKLLYRITAYMRIIAFKNFISAFDVVKKWSYGDILYEPLAQHYGLETNWLDITNDFNTALFFATCYWNRKEKRWLPLKKEQTEKDENTKYGVIFHIPAWQASINCLSAQNDSKTNVILPIGFQPFMRCQSQYAYGIKMEKPFPLQEDVTFEKLYFRHNEKLSRDVYDLMGQGNKIYPQEGLNEFKDIIEKINKMTVFSVESFAEVCTALKIDKEFYYKDLLIKHGVQITEDCPSVKISRQRLRAMNRKYWDFSLEKYFGVKLHYRLVKYGNVSLRH